MFSVRYGIEPSELPIQKNDVNNVLANGLWNCIYTSFLEGWKPSLKDERRNYAKKLIRTIVIQFEKNPIDEFANFSLTAEIPRLKKLFFAQAWNKKFDLIEFIIQSEQYQPYRRDTFIQCCNSHLIKENSAYRIVDGVFVDIISDEEINAITSVIESSPHTLISTHFRRALQLMSNRENPDYRNSIKESISAVELMCKLILHDEKATLGQALDKIGKSMTIPLHENLKEAYKKLYGWTSDDQGIRHALKDDPNVDYKDAKFMLVICSAFVNYLFEECSQNGIALSLTETT